MERKLGREGRRERVRRERDIELGEEGERGREREREGGGVPHELLIQGAIESRACIRREKSALENLYVQKLADMERIAYHKTDTK